MAESCHTLHRSCRSVVETRCSVRPAAAASALPARYCRRDTKPEQPSEASAQAECHCRPVSRANCETAKTMRKCGLCLLRTYVWQASTTDEQLVPADYDAHRAQSARVSVRALLHVDQHVLPATTTASREGLRLCCILATKVAANSSSATACHCVAPFRWCVARKHRPIVHAILSAMTPVSHQSLPGNQRTRRG